MPLKLSKLEKLLYDNRLIITTFYVKGEKCIFVKVFSIDTGYSFIISIDQEYDLKVTTDILEGKNFSSGIVVLDEIIYKEGESTIEKYSSYPADKELKENYDIEFKKDFGEGHEFEANLENGYKKKIFLRDIEKDTDQKLKDCTRQLKRLSLSFADLQYSICLIEDKLFVLSVEDRVKSYFIKSQSTDGNRLLFVLVSLEFFYETGQSVIKDVEDIKEALFNILDKNSDNNLQKLMHMLQKFDSVGNTIEQISQLKLSLNHYIASYQKLLKEIVNTEKETVKALEDLEESHTEGKTSDVNYVHRKRVLDEKKDHSIRVKQQILKNMTSAINKCDNIYLKNDKCDFENAILVDAVIKNLKDNEKEIQKNSV
jgi:hypothetical protein